MGQRGQPRKAEGGCGAEWPRRVESSCHQQMGEVARQRGPVGRSRGPAAKLGRRSCRRDCFDGRSEEKWVVRAAVDDGHSFALHGLV